MELGTDLWLLRHPGCRKIEGVVDKILEITVTGGLKNKTGHFHLISPR